MTLLFEVRGDVEDIPRKTESVDVVADMTEDVVVEEVVVEKTKSRPICDT